MEQEETRRALVVMAHPDDIEFTCGGTIAKLCAEGWDVYYVLATSGDKGTHDEEVAPEQLARQREDEQRAAAQVLGVRDCVFLGYPDGFLEDTAETRGQVVRLIRYYKPHTVITWDPYRRSHNHRDHRTIGQVTADATFPLSRGHLFYSEHLGEGLTAHRAEEMLLAGTDQPDYYVDISPYIGKKVDALMCHASQTRTRTRDDLAKTVRERGQQVAKRAKNMPLAEGFRRISFRR